MSASPPAPDVPPHPGGRAAARARRATLRGMPGGVWALGVASLCMDTSSELIHSLLPAFMATVLGASMLTIGVVEGVAEATAAVTKVFSGALSDHLRRRKGVIVLGYGLAALTKPVFPLAASIRWVFAARFVDRIGKGIRGAPRDALVAELAPPRLRGAAYGLRQALDSVGAVLGPLLATVLLAWSGAELRAVMWAAAPPAALTLVVLAAFVHEPARAPAPAAGPVALAGARRLPARYWLVVLVGAVFTLARFSEAFLLLRAQDVGLPLPLVPVVIIAMNLVYALLAYPAGAAADRVSARALLLGGLGVLIAADLVLAGAAAPPLVLVGAALWGAHMALTQGLLAKLVADEAPRPWRGTAFGIFNLVSGGALLLASVIAGALWTAIGPAATFLAGAAFAAATAVGLLGVRAPGRRAG